VIDEDGPGQLHVVLMERADKRIVAAEHVAVADRKMRALSDRANEVADDRGLERDLQAHRGERAVGQEQTGEEIGRLGDGRRAGDALQRDAHLLSDREQPRTYDLVGDGADGRGLANAGFRLARALHRETLTCRLPCASAFAMPRGGMTTLWP